MKTIQKITKGLDRMVRDLTAVATTEYDNMGRRDNQISSLRDQQTISQANADRAEKIIKNIEGLLT